MSVEAYNTVQANIRGYVVCHQVNHPENPTAHRLVLGGPFGSSHPAGIWLPVNMPAFYSLNKKTTIVFPLRYGVSSVFPEPDRFYIVSAHEVF